MSRPSSSSSKSAGKSRSTARSAPDFLSSLVRDERASVSTDDAALAIRAALAKKTKLFDVAKLLKAALDARADAMKTSVSDAFVDIYRRVVEAPKPSADDPFRNPCFATVQRSDAFYRCMYGEVWPALIAFRDAAASWRTEWHKDAVSLTVLYQHRDVAPPGAFESPNTQRVIEAARTVACAFQKALSGFGVGIARAAGYEAERVRGLLEIEGLPEALNCGSREGIILKLELAVDRDDHQLERDLAAYVTTVLGIAAEGEVEPLALATLVTRAGGITWDRFKTQS